MMLASQDFPPAMHNSPYSMKGIYDCEIIEQHEVSPGVYRTLLTGEEIARQARAGQFLNVQVSRSTDPLMRRPFSVHAVYPDEGRFTLLYVVVGRGTELLRHIPAGDKVSVVGPLGRGFDVGESPDAEHIVVAGGCGAAPLHFLCDALCKKWGCENVLVLAGGRSKNAVLCEAEFRAHGVQVGISTDDGTYGHGGFVTQLLEQALGKRQQAIGRDLSRVRVYSCGPHPMVREVARICREAGVGNCQVSLENNMACGMGVCVGCVQKVRVQSSKLKVESAGDWEWKRVCKDGPVFDAEDVIWE